MVVVCESCSTRFRIDDARIPAKGRLVRCSQCKATFVATPESASFDEVIDEVVAEVSAAGGAPLPEPAADLFEAGGGDLDDPTTRPEPAFDEERWEFDDAPRASVRESAEDAVFEPRSEPDAEPDALEEVGDPAEWNLLRHAVAPAAREARFVEPAAAARAPVADSSADSFLDPIVAQPEPPRATQRARANLLASFARSALSAGAWLAVLASAVFSIAPLLANDAVLRSASVQPRTLPLADGEARAVQAGFVENAFAGSLFVIAGEIARPGADSQLGLRAYLVDEAGARIGTPRWAGVARSARDLRELAPETLLDALDASSAAAARGGPFVVFFEQLPPEAASFELALEPLPDPSPDPSHRSANEAEPALSASPTTPAAAEPTASPTTPAAAEPTASSAPSLLPSSG